MSDDKKVPLKDGEVIDFGDSIYHGVCSTCGLRVEMFANFDADGTDYNGECCGMRIWSRPHTVKIAVYKKE